MPADDFAKLFRHPTVGQVLVTHGYNSEEDTCDDDAAPYEVRVKVVGHAEVETAFGFAEESIMLKAFEAFSEADALHVVDTLVKRHPAMFGENV
jgi:hypothetical protein